MKTIKIVGGGLSGLSLGIALRRKSVPVIIYEVGRYPRHKVCGEFVCGVSTRTLDNLGIEDMFEASSQYTESLWFSAGEEILRTQLDPPAWGMSRYYMDDWLQKKFRQLGGKLLTGERVECRPRQGQVWAAGRIPQKNSKWVGLKIHLRGYDLKSELEMHLGDAGYAGLIAVEDGWVNVCGLFEKRKINSKGDELLLIKYLKSCGLEGLADELSHCEIRKNSESAVAGFNLGRQEGVDGLCVLGDSESIIPPFTGNGMSMTFEAAEMAVQPLLDFAQDKIGWEKCCLEISSKLNNKFSTRLSIAALCHPFLLNQKAQRVLKRAAAFNLLPFSTLFNLSR